MLLPVLHPIVLPSVDLRNRHQLPREPGIYYCCKGLKVLYVGKANSLYSRWNGVKIHYRSFQSLIDDCEAKAIAYHKPPLNLRKESRVAWFVWMERLRLVMIGFVVASLLIQCHGVTRITPAQPQSQSQIKAY